MRRALAAVAIALLLLGVVACTPTPTEARPARPLVTGPVPETLFGCHFVAIWISPADFPAACDVWRLHGTAPRWHQLHLAPGVWYDDPGAGTGLSRIVSAIDHYRPQHAPGTPVVYTLLGGGGCADDGNTTGMPDWVTQENVLEAWREHVRFMAARFRGTIRYWEIANEPDHAFCWFNLPASVADVLPSSAVDDTVDGRLRYAEHGREVVRPRAVRVQGPDAPHIGLGELGPVVTRPRAITRLFDVRRPAAVPGRVRPVAVDTVQGGIGWPRSHVGKEVLERQPPFTDNDAARAIPAPVRGVRVVAALEHALPRAVLPRCTTVPLGAVPVGGFSPCCGLASETPTGCAAAPSQHRACDCPFCSAITLTQPPRVARARVGYRSCPADHGPAAESLTTYVDGGPHASDSFFLRESPQRQFDDSGLRHAEFFGQRDDEVARSGRQAETGRNLRLAHSGNVVQTAVRDKRVALLVDLTRIAAEEVRAIDPTALVIGPAFTAEAGVGMAADFYLGGGGQYIDIAAVHVSFEYPPENNAGKLERMRAVIGDDALPLWVTEMHVWRGAAPDSALVVRSYLTALLHGVQMVGFYAWDFPPGSGGFDLVAMVDTTGAPTAAGRAYAHLRAQLRGRSVVRADEWSVVLDDSTRIERRLP